METECPCDSCESCDSCEGCDTCNSGCDTCNADCDTYQALCEINSMVLSDYVGNFGWSNCASSGEIMGPGYFDINTWNEICSFINKRASVGSKVPGGSSFSENSSITPSNPAFTATEFNRVANELSISNVTQGSIIYGSYFSSLESAANRYQISSNACDTCNADCDAPCDDCIDCDACEGCDNGGNATVCHDSYTYCCSCDMCEDTPAPCAE